MAIADGLQINCSDLQAVGGTRLVAIRVWTENDAVTWDDANHEIDTILTSSSASAWGVFESRIESSSLSVNGSAEGKDCTTYECSLSFFVPGMTKTQFDRINEFTGKCLMVLVIDNNDATSGSTAPSAAFTSNKVIGVSHTKANADKAFRTQQYATLTSVEGGTGAAYGDEIGVTVNITATQYETPRQYAGAIALDGDGLGLTTS
ncbi:MAG: hypothetical protein Unbinned8210contig1002_17 [Prokaryotic dsDNA virus sp.]|nr:MAG: hypothetical protein Unbinned8210contig1002_17 [Prokaryotic dsDNA virus sp.]|tara:strand:+ start:18159 stop:18773 length:615 start_codon:yes stop_codon:yes gene_type:complete